MAVEQKHGPGSEAGGHGQSLFGVELDQDEALPIGTGGIGVSLQLAQEGLLELVDLLDVDGGDEGLGGGSCGIGEDNIFEFVGAGWKDGGTLVDFGGIEQVEDGKVLNLKDFVHAFDAESAFAIEEIGDVSLFESRLLGEFEASKFT